MSVLLPGKPKVRTSQPRDAARIDRSNPLTHGLVLLLPMGPVDRGQQCLIQGGRTTRTGTVPQTPGGAGNAYTLPLFGSSNYIDFVQPEGITSTTPCTIFWTQEPRATSASSAVLDWKATGASNSFLIYQSTTASYNFVVGRRLSNLGAHQVTFSASVGAPTNNRVDTYCLILPNGMDSVTGVRLFRNGAEMAAGTSNTTNNFATSTSAGQRIGALIGGSDPFEGLLGSLGVAARAFTEAEAVSITRNPWQIYATERRTPLVFAEGGGGGTQDLLPDLFTNSQSFYAPTISASYALTPDLFTNDQTFYSPTVTPGAVTLTPDLFTNGQTFYSATVSQVSPQELLPDLFTNSQSFYAPTVSASYTLAPSLLTNGQTFYGPTVTVGAVTLLPQRFTNTNTFYSATITGGAVQVRTKGLRKTRYVPRRIFSRRPEFEEITRSFNEELERLNDALESPDTHQLLEQLNTEPGRKLAGTALIVYADGVNFDPGSGEGVYAYYGGSWKKLG